MSEPMWIVAAGVFGGVVTSGYLLWSLFDRYGSELDARLAEMRTHRTGRGSPPLPVSRGGVTVQRPWLVVMERLAPDSALVRQRFQQRMQHAGFYAPTAMYTYFSAKLALMVSPPLIGLLVGWLELAPWSLALASGCFAGGLGLLLPAFWLERRIGRRHMTLRRSLADFLDLMIVCLEGGLSLHSTLQRVTDELQLAHPVLAGELNIVQRDIELGATIDVALRRFAERSGYEGIRMLGTFVREAQRLGTELAVALREHADMLRDQREQAAEELAQKASVKILFPTLLLILPAVFIVIAGPAAIQIQEAFSK